MWTGRQTLASIENAIVQLHGEENQLDHALRSAVSDTERLRTQRSQSLRELARIKLGEMAAGRLVGNLDAGERRALKILDDYRFRITAAVEQCEALQKEVTGAQAYRHTAAAAVEAALDTVDQVRAEAEKKVQTTPSWREAKATRDRADAVAAEAEKKAEASAAELGAKRKPYDEDPLFAYLWRRRFGTAQYAGGNFTRIVDRLVADFIGYSNARPNYTALIEIPLRLKEHATARREAAADPQALLAQIERNAMLEAGVDAKEQILAEARHKLAVVDDTVEQKSEMLRKVDEARAALVAGDSNPAYNDALATIASADAGDSLANLYAEARRTPTGADEALIAQLESIDANIARTEAEIANLRRAAIDLSRRRAEMDEVRKKFRGTGYDHPQSRFENDGDIGRALGSVLEGAVRSGVLWDLLRQGHRARPSRGSTDFGGPDFPFPFPNSGGGGARGGEWRNPSSRGGWSSERSGSQRDSDGFSTGGSF